MNGEINATEVRRLAGGEAAAENLIRHGYLAARESAGKRKARTQKIVAWAGAQETDVAESPATDTSTITPARTADSLAARSDTA